MGKRFNSLKVSLLLNGFVMVLCWGALHTQTLAALRPGWFK